MAQMTSTHEDFTMPSRPIFDEVWGERFQHAMRAYMETLYASLDSDDLTVEAETLSGYPFCGCEDCHEREYLLMAVALTVQGYEAGDVRLERDLDKPLD